MLELGHTLYACDEALENERWLPGGAGFKSSHLLPTDAGPWSSEDGSLSGPTIDAVAPPRDGGAWSEVAPWHVHVDVSSGSTDRRGWCYARALPRPLGHSADDVEISGSPFAGAVARRRRWLRVYARPLGVRSTDDAGPTSPGGAAAARRPSAFFGRLQESWRSGLIDAHRRFMDHASPTKRATMLLKEPAPAAFEDRWARPEAARCRASVHAFVRNFGKHETDETSDDVRSARVKRFLEHAERLLRAHPVWAKDDDDAFEETADRLAALVYGALERAGFKLIKEGGSDDAELASRLDRMHRAVTHAMLDAADVAAEPAFADALRCFHAVPAPRPPKSRLASRDPTPPFSGLVSARRIRRPKAAASAPASTVVSNVVRPAATTPPFEALPFGRPRRNIRVAGDPPFEALSFGRRRLRGIIRAARPRPPREDLSAASRPRRCRARSRREER